MSGAGQGVRIVASGAALTRRVLEVCAMLGMGVYHRDEPPCSLHRIGDEVRSCVETLSPGAHAYITGESGSGKSTMLSGIEAFLAARGDVCVPVDAAALWRQRLKSPVDVCDGPIEVALATLACAGLAEGPLMIRPIQSMSEGQRWRLALAVAMQRAARSSRQRRSWLVVDECASCLDARTAQCVCRAVARWATREEVSIIAAGNWEAPGLWLGASRTLYTGSERST